MALSHAILTALLDQELTGYELAKQFDVSLGFFWQASHQQIYQQLKVLNDQQLVVATEVSQSGRPDKKRYALTPSGREHLKNWVLGETRRKPAKDDLLVKLYNLGTVDNADIIEMVASRLQDHKQRLALYEKIREKGYARLDELDRHHLGMYLALSAGLHQERSFIAWCEEAIGLLGSTRDFDS